MKAPIFLLALIAAVTATSFYDGSQSALGDFLLGSHPGFDVDLSAPRLVQLNDQDEPVVMTELEKLQAKARGVRFFDITETPGLGSHARVRATRTAAYPAPRHMEAVRSVIDTLEIQNLRDNLETFTSFWTRYYRSLSGKQSQRWLLEKIKEITRNYAPEALQEFISVEEFTHSWTQSSIILRINGSSTTDDGVVILGAHLDSINQKSPFLRAPGADDDGSGSMSILEAYRALVVAGFRPERTVEFHWYSAEEGGLLGSQAIAHDYEARGVNVYAMTQYDMTAFVKRGTEERVGIVTDDVDSGLISYNKKLIELYLDIPWVETTCGFACSDHASWRKAGYPSIYLLESKFMENNREYGHTEFDLYDISDEFSFPHMLEFSKLAVAFAIELGGWADNE
ncbi:peptidase [Cubamyces sp. BRFM 1775]|nr:peptidase [Cubamyces sp. BRFM 1775]